MQDGDGPTQKALDETLEILENLEMLGFVERKTVDGVLHWRITPAGVRWADAEKAETIPGVVLDLMGTDFGRRRN